MQKKILTTGTFNLCHAGHIRLFEFCSQFGEVIVGINADPYLWEKYGPLNEKINLAFDLDFFLKILGNQANSVYIPDLIGAWRIWESNKCTIFSSQLNNEVNKVKNIHKRENSIYKNKIIKKLARKIVKISQQEFAMKHGLPKIGRIVYTKEKVNQLFIPLLWKIIINIKT